MNHLSTITPSRLQLQLRPDLVITFLVELPYTPFITVYSNSNSNPFVMTIQTTFIHIRISHSSNHLSLNQSTTNRMWHSALSFILFFQQLMTYNNYDITRTTTLMFYLWQLQPYDFYNNPGVPTLTHTLCDIQNSALTHFLPLTNSWNFDPLHNPWTKTFDTLPTGFLSFSSL